MNERLKSFLQAENLNQARAAEITGLPPATFSHIISGRSKPSYEFLQTFISKFPNINAEWLLLGTGKMYKEHDMTETQKINSQTLIPEQKQPEIPSQEQPVDDLQTSNPTLSEEPENTTDENLAKIEVKKARVKKIILLYEDNSYQIL